LNTRLKENATASVYGDTFALYDEASFDAFLEPLRIRLDRNGIGLDQFSGKDCLDAGCGGGRATVLMGAAGARLLCAIDYSPENTRTTAAMAHAKGLTGVRMHRGSVLDLPFGDASFDVVWCNGVLHHTADPDRGLCELTRVLRPDGKLWLYLYGAGGLYWHVVKWIRARLADVSMAKCLQITQLLDTPVGRIAEWMDDWYVPYLRTYTRDDVTTRLHELGFADAAVLTEGTEYDTSHRRARAETEERSLLGEGDLRFFCTKTGDVAGHTRRLPDPPSGWGSDYRERDAVLAIDEHLNRLAHALAQRVAREPAARALYVVLVCRALHRRTRALLERPEPMRLDPIREVCARLIAQLESAVD